MFVACVCATPLRFAMVAFPLTRQKSGPPWSRIPHASASIQTNSDGTWNRRMGCASGTGRAAPRSPTRVPPQCNSTATSAALSPKQVQGSDYGHDRKVSQGPETSDKLSAHRPALPHSQDLGKAGLMATSIAMCPFTPLTSRARSTAFAVRTCYGS